MEHPTSCEGTTLAGPQTDARGTMGSVADYLAKAIDCEEMARQTEAKPARALFLAIAISWREMAAEAAEKAAARQAVTSSRRREARS